MGRIVLAEEEKNGFLCCFAIPLEGNLANGEGIQRGEKKEEKKESCFHFCLLLLDKSFFDALDTEKTKDEDDAYAVEGIPEKCLCFPKENSPSDSQGMGKGEDFSKDAKPRGEIGKGKNHTREEEHG